jgi:lipopolysaccharide transport system permease protein
MAIPENKKDEVDEGWTEIIRPKPSFLHLGLYESWKYRDLIMLFIRRDFVSTYKQTILGPLWHIVQPLVTTLILTFVFRNIAKLSTDEAPPFLFYMCGVTLWNYFSHTLSSTANTFVNNAHLFGKVYFPRLTVPLSVSFSSFISLGIQLSMLLLFYIWYVWNGADLKVNIWILALPWFLFILTLWSLGLGIIVSSMTTKYKDLRHVISFGIPLYMFISPVVLPVSSLNEKIKFWAMLNPVSPVMEGFRYALLGKGDCAPGYLLIATSVSLLVFITGLLIFNKVEKTFMDTV